MLPLRATASRDYNIPARQPKGSLVNIRLCQGSGNSFVSRTKPPGSPDDHIILGVLGYMPRDFAFQMNLNLVNEWGIVRTIVDTVLKMDDGKYVLVKDPNKSVLRLSAVPAHTFDEEESVAEMRGEAEDKK